MTMKTPLISLYRYFNCWGFKINVTKIVLKLLTDNTFIQNIYCTFVIPCKVTAIQYSAINSVYCLVYKVFG